MAKHQEILLLKPGNEICKNALNLDNSQNRAPGF